MLDGDHIGDVNDMVAPVQSYHYVDVNKMIRNCT